LNKLRNSIVSVYRILIAAEGWESPTEKRQSWRRKLNDGGYEYRYRDPNEESGDPIYTTNQTPKEHVSTRIPPKLTPVISVKEDLIRYKDFETLVCYDNDGNKIFDLTGNEDSVPISEDYKDKIKGHWLTHNHPRSSSFSRQDIVVLKKFEGRGMRVVSKKYDYEFCFLDSYNLSAEQTEEKLLKINSEIRKKYEGLIFEGRLTIEDANANHQHALMTVFAKTTPGVFYVRKQHVG